jgi:hypothetical protein
MGPKELHPTGGAQFTKGHGHRLDRGHKGPFFYKKKKKKNLKKTKTG